jgi:hypothetical protein
MKIRNCFITAIITFSLQVVFVNACLAIPAFTRAHKTECLTCHTIFPELTEQGENFKKNSFVWLETKGAEKPGEKKDAKKDGKKGLNEREYLILSSLPEYLPLSVSGAFNASYDDKRFDDGNKFDFVTRAIVLQGGGSFNDILGFWLSYNLYTSGPFDPTTNGSNMNPGVPKNNLPDLNDAYVQARHIFGTPINFKLGRIHPSLSLWKGTNKTSMANMATTSYRVGSSPYYVDAAADGIELNTILGGRVFLAGGTVKRKDQRNLEGFGSVQLKLGGADFEGREAPVNFDEESIFDILSITLGAYGFAGNNNVGADRQLNVYHRYGFEGDVRYQRYRLKLASVFGEDDNSILDGTAHGPLINKRSRVFSAEGLYLIGSSIIPSFRYEFEDNGSSVTRRYIPAVAYAPLQNGKLVLEYKHESSTTDRGLVNLGFTASF